MKRILFSGLLLCLSLSLFAQNSNEISAASSIRKWADGPLTLEDFSYRTGGNSDKAMRLSYGIRWKDDKYGVIPPIQFIPVLEQDAVFPSLGRWILKQAMSDGTILLKEHPDLIMNINLSYFHHPRFFYIYN